MAIEAIAAVAAKEIGVAAAKEAAMQAGREIAQKMATEAGTQCTGNELQTAMMERQTMQEGFRIGEMPETKGEGREILKQKEADAADELRGKLDTGEAQPETEPSPESESPEVQNLVESETPRATGSEEVRSAETQETTEVAEQLEKAKSDYADDLVSRSDVPETLDKREIVETDYEKVSVEECRAMRDEFNQKKNDLISQWEEEHGIKWPTYSEDVHFKGKTIREAGNKYDAHHIQPLTHGGKNEATNITPLHALEHCDHQGLHAFNSPYSRLDNLLKLKEVA